MASSTDPLRSSCPIVCALDLLGDRWTLVVLRDILLAGRHSFSQMGAAEGIATNILSDRLERLHTADVIKRCPDPSDGRRRIYLPTEKGVQLIPVLLDLLVWGLAHTPGTAHAELGGRAMRDRDALIVELQETARAAMA